MTVEELIEKLEQRPRNQVVEVVVKLKHGDAKAGVAEREVVGVRSTPPSEVYPTVLECD